MSSRTPSRLNDSGAHTAVSVETDIVTVKLNPQSQTHATLNLKDVTSTLSQRTQSQRPKTTTLTSVISMPYSRATRIRSSDLVRNDVDEKGNRGGAPSQTFDLDNLPPVYARCGELQTGCGRNQMTGYMANPRLGLAHVLSVEQQNTNAMTSDGFFKTGLVGSIDREGWVRAYGHWKDMIRVVPASNTHTRMAAARARATSATESLPSASSTSTTSSERNAFSRANVKPTAGTTVSVTAQNDYYVNREA